jgi:hypothetical protein
MTLLRIGLLSLEAEIEVTSGDRVYKVSGNDHVSIEMLKAGDSVTITLVKNVAGADKFKGVPLEDPEMRMRPLPPSDKAGVYLVRDGQAFYQSKPKPKGKK